MRVLVTGAAGFVGRRVVAHFTGLGHDVLGLVRPGAATQESALEGVEIVSGDLTDPLAVFAAVQRAQVVIHCAARCTDWGAEKDFFASNVEGLRVLLDAAARNRSLRRFVHFSTTDVYGYPTMAGGEGEPTRDVGLPYNRTKIAGERLVHSAVEQGLPGVVLRPATIYGPGGAAVLVSLVEALRSSSMVYVNSGVSHAGLIHVDDVVMAVERAIELDVAVGGVFNLVNPEPVTWRQLTEVTADELGLARPRLFVPLRPALAVARLIEALARRRRVRPTVTRHALLLLGRPQDFDASQARRVLGFEASTAFDVGIGPALAEFRANSTAPATSDP